MAEQEIQEKGYAHPEALVTTEWVQQNLDDTHNIRIVESDEDVLLYDIGHVPNAVKVDWVEDLNDSLTRDYLDPEHFASLMSQKGITPETTVVFYGDKNNWWACYAFWVFQLFGHTNAKVLNSGRKKWIDEGRPLVLYGDGSQERDYTFIDDIARGTIAALRPVGFEVINLGGDEPVSIREVIAQLEELIGKPSHIDRQPEAPGDVRATWANIDKARSLLDWEPQVSRLDGLAECVAWYRAEKAWAASIDTTD